jgi:hypothetical protein
MPEHSEPKKRLYKEVCIQMSSDRALKTVAEPCLWLDQEARPVNGFARCSWMGMLPRTQRSRSVPKSTARACLA